MKIKTIISTLATLLTVFCLTLNVAAVTPTIFTLGSEECYAGDTITLPISITHNSGFSRARIAIKYDDEIFTLTQKATDKGLIPGGFHSNKLESPYKLSWEVDSDAEDTYAEGIVAELTFKVSSTAKTGKYEIEIVIMDDSVISADGKSVEVQSINGNIYIVQDPEDCSHSWGDWVSSSIKKHKRTCELCSETETEQHDWDNGEVTVEPEIGENGVMTYTCDICSGTKTETIPALEPDEYDITGTVTSSGDADEAVTVILYDADGTVIDSDTTTDGTYTLSAPDGTYTLEVSKTKHATREYSVTVDSDDIMQNVEIWLYGDVTGDGLVNMTDVTQIKRKYNSKSSIFGSSDETTEEYRLIVANVYATDGVINMTDVTQIKRYYNGLPSIFDSIQ